MANKKSKQNKLSLDFPEGMDSRGHVVRAYKEGGKWFVERNNNGAVHPEPCKNEAEARKLFDEYCNAE